MVLLTGGRTACNGQAGRGSWSAFTRPASTEESYWQVYEDAQQARGSLAALRARDNEVRPHWTLVPAAGGDAVARSDAYLRGVKVALPRWQGPAKAAKARLPQT
jgi:hypothetical protein